MNLIVNTPTELYNAFTDILKEIQQEYPVGFPGPKDINDTPEYKDAVLWFQQNALRIRGQNLLLDLAPVPTTSNPVDMLNWCIDAQKIINKATQPKTDATIKNKKTLNAFVTPPPASSDSEKTTPDDLITLLVALTDYEVSRPTIKRKIKDGDIHSYRKPEAPCNSPHLVSRAEIEKYYNAKK